jgi:hypothetical protein
VISLIFLSVSVFAESPPAKILYVGAIAINPCQDAKVLADWYSRFGIETKEYQGGYYGQLNTTAGPFFFGIHPKKADAPKNVRRVFQSYFASKISTQACWPRKVKDCCPIRPKKIRTKASLRTFTTQTATKLLSGEEKYEPD